MKLKQRVVMLILLTFTLSSLFVLGTHLSRIHPEDMHPPTISRDTMLKPPKIRKAGVDLGHSIDNPSSKLHSNITISTSDHVWMEGSKGQNPKGQGLSDGETRDAWTMWKSWVIPESLYPSDAFYSKYMNHILVSMATTPITSFGIGYKGTQLKATVMLGQQRAVFKPKRYKRDHVIEGGPYAGFDRHNGEIAGFHLDGILGFRIAPPVVGRKINLTFLLPLTSQQLLDTYFKQDGNTCFYGRCYYCKPAEAACADGEIMEGSLTLWLPEWYKLKVWRHPYQRTYQEGYKARWETDEGFCLSLLNPSSRYYHGILEFTDTCIYDFLMGNADRHHYETYSEARPHGKLLHIDNGKTFGNHSHDELSILAPLTQCCRVRRSTWERLKSLSLPGRKPLSHVLNESMRRDPLYPILTQPHLNAIDRRLSIIMAAIEKCITWQSVNTVVVDSWG